MKRLLYILIVLAVIGAVLAYVAYQGVKQDNIDQLPNDGIFEILPESSYDDVFSKLKEQGILNIPATFDQLAQYMNYKKDRVPSGRYKIKDNMSNLDLIRMLRAGNQQPVNLTFNNARLVSDLAGKLDDNILLDSLVILQALEDEKFLQQYDFTKETIMSLFIPNTYKVFWDIDMHDLMKRMKQEHKRFWNEDRVQKAKNLKMSKEEVYTLASIVDKESHSLKEKPIIAGVYLNRLQRGIALQADPTVVFAVQDFSIRRVLNKHLEYDSPYNTYKYPGLPPGPIGMASIAGLDAVLNPAQHDYIFFCAKPDGGGTHAFAKSLSEHNRNARIYQNWLSRRGIR